MDICEYIQYIWRYSSNDGRTIKKCPKKHLYTKQQNQNQPSISWNKKIALFWKYVIFFNNLIRGKKAW